MKKIIFLFFVCLVAMPLFAQKMTTTYSYTWQYDSIYSMGSGVQKFNYTGAVQTFVAPEAGTYTLEVWGAQGGAGTYGASLISLPGGKGGYSTGIITLNKGCTLYVYVGGQGVSDASLNSQPGGFNGGGASANLANTTGNTLYKGSGGGASDIRVESTSLYARVIVAGGGGGSGGQDWSEVEIPEGGYGGGITGGNGGTSFNDRTGGSGATQTSGGAYGTYSSGYNGISGTFGSGGQGGGCSSNYGRTSGGGGGWYGGGGGGAGGTGSGGGSGYVYTSSTAGNYPAGCLLNSSYYLTSANTYAGNTSFASTSSGTEQGHSGNGYAIITYDHKVFDHVDSLLKHTQATTTIEDTVCQKAVYVAFGFSLKCDTLSVGLHTYKLSYHLSADRDSTVILKLEVKEESVVYEEVECPAPYVWHATGLSYYESGVYTANLVSENGCDSTITLALTIVSTAGISNKDNLGLKVYPNPASEYVEVVIENNSVSEFFLYDISGHLIKKELLENSQNRISLRSIPSGIYLMKFCGDKGTVCKKLVIDK